MRFARLIVIVAPLIVAVACGTLDATDSSPPVEGGPLDAAPDTSSGDAGDASDGDVPSSCDLASPWGTPVALIKRTDLVTGAASLTDDELTVYFDVLVGGVRNAIFRATRARKTDGFGTGVEMSPPNSGATQNYQPAIAPDGVTLFFTSNRDQYGIPQGSRHIWVATLLDGGSDFGTPTSVGVGGANDDYQPFPSGNELWFESNRFANDYDLFHAQLDGSVGSLPAAVTELNSATTDSSPVLSRDGLTIFLGSDRPGSDLIDIWTAARPTRDDPFGPPSRVAELSSPDNDRPTWLSPNGCRIYLAAKRDTKDVWVYVSSRTR